MTQRAFFAGCNTPEGFFSCYNQLLPQKEAKTIYCIKGGPGTGKSHFLAALAEEFEALSCTVERYFCSSDPACLDGILIREYQTLLTDATPPHIMEPQNPGACDVILSFGDFFNMEQLRKQKEKIMAFNHEVNRLHARACRFLKTARELTRDTCNIYQNSFLHTAFEKKVSALLQHIFENRTGKGAEERQIFLSAVTPDGFVHFLEESVTASRVICILSEAGDCAPLLLSRIRQEALHRGFYTETFFSPLEPTEKPEHLFLPELDTAVITSNSYHSFSGTEAWSLEDCYRSLDRSELRFNREWTDAILNKAIAVMGEARKAHDALEQCYIPHVDFEQLEILRQTVKEEILTLSLP